MPGRPRTREPRKPGPSAPSRITVHTPLPPPELARDNAYSAERAAKVLAAIAGGLSLRKTCASPDMPSKSAFLEWVSKDEALADQYARAMTIRADHGFDEIIDLADQASEKGADVQALKLRVDTRKWAFSKMNARKYGEFHRQEITGDQGGPLNIRNMTDDQLNARLAALVSGAQPGAADGNGNAPRGESPAPANEQAPGVLP